MEESVERPRIGRPARRPLPGAEEVEERETLEIEREAVSLEVPAPVVGREIIDLDDQVEIVAARRIREAELRNRGWQASDHRAFDARIRRPKAAATPTARRRITCWSTLSCWAWRCRWCSSPGCLSGW